MKKVHSFHKVIDRTSLLPLKQEWQKSLLAPQDGMWEVLTGLANHFEIRENPQTIGYACVDEGHRLLQFFVQPEWLPEGVSILEQFNAENGIKEALVGTNNPVCCTILMQLQRSVAVHTYLFTDFFNVPLKETQGTPILAQPKDLERIVDFCHLSTGGPKVWLNGYLGNLIERQELFALDDGTEILGTFEVRKSESDPSFADIGMIVSPAYRRKGLGTFLLGKAKEKALEWGKSPICSCEKDNLGSLKAIRNNGFRSVHQLLLMKF